MPLAKGHVELWIAKKLLRKSQTFIVGRCSRPRFGLENLTIYNKSWKLWQQQLEIVSKV